MALANFKKTRRGLKTNKSRRTLKNKKTRRSLKNKKGGKRRKSKKNVKKMKGGGVEVELIIPPLVRDGTCEKYMETINLEEEYDGEPLINEAGEKVTYGGVAMYIGNSQNEGKLTSLYFEHPQGEESKKIIRHSDMMKKVDFDKEDDIVAELPDDLKKHILQEKNYQYFVHTDFEEIYKDLIGKGMDAYGMFQNKKPEEQEEEQEEVQEQEEVPEEQEEQEEVPEEEQEQEEKVGGKKKSRKSKKSVKK